MAWLPVDEAAVRAIGPALADLGYTEVKRNTCKGEVFSVEFINPTADEMTRRPGCELYVRDAYGNSRGEAFLCVWNWIGMPGPVQAVADHLTRLGIPSRATTHNKLRGVRFLFNPFVEETQP